MNAYELAEKLETCCLVSWGECTPEDYDTDIWTKMRSASMLRQQQEEIERLKSLVDSLFGGLETSLQLNKELIKKEH